jgi:uncharacterized protein (DUF1778 family)
MAKKPTAPRGRPKKQPGEARSNVLQVRLTDAEKQALDEAAQFKGMDTSTWVRVEMLSLAREAQRSASAD